MGGTRDNDDVGNTTLGGSSVVSRPVGASIVTPLARGGMPDTGVIMISSFDRVWTRPNNRFISFHAPGTPGRD